MKKMINKNVPIWYFSSGMAKPVKLTKSKKDENWFCYQKCIVLEKKDIGKVIVMQDVVSFSSATKREVDVFAEGFNGAYYLIRNFMEPYNNN